METIRQLWLVGYIKILMILPEYDRFRGTRLQQTIHIDIPTIKWLMHYYWEYSIYLLNLSTVKLRCYYTVGAMIFNGEFLTKMEGNGARKRVTIKIHGALIKAQILLHYQLHKNIKALRLLMFSCNRNKNLQILCIFEKFGILDRQYYNPSDDDGKINGVCQKNLDVYRCQSSTIGMIIIKFWLLVRFLNILK